MDLDRLGSALVNNAGRAAVWQCQAASPAGLLLGRGAGRPVRLHAVCGAGAMRPLRLAYGTAAYVHVSLSGFYLLIAWPSYFLDLFVLLTGCN